jgi:small-conductance mechanosensitive channel
MNSLTFLYIVYFTTIVVDVIAALITAAFVIPLQIKQNNVRNGLSRLRKQMLIKGVLSFAVIAFTIAALTARFFISELETLRYIIVTLILVQALGTLGKSIVDFQIYHTQYTEENKMKHAEIERLEEESSTN